MDVQWPLVFFTLLNGLGVGAFSCVAALEWLGAAPSIRLQGAVTALAAMALGSALGFLHLSHPFRVRHIPRHLDTGVGREMLLGGLTSFFVFLYIVLFATDFSGLSTKLAASLGLISGVAMAFEMGALYMLPARPAWNTRIWPIIYAASSAAAGLFTMALWAAASDDPARASLARGLGMTALVSLIVLAGCVFAYLAFLSRAPYKEDRRGPARLLAGDMAPLFWAGVVFSGLAVPAAASAYAAVAKTPAFLPNLAALAGVLIGGVAVRSLMYLLGSEADPILTAGKR